LYTLVKLFLLIVIFEFESFISMRAFNKTVELVDILTAEPTLVKLVRSADSGFKSFVDCVTNDDDEQQDFFRIYF
jgi:hypothetical protein